MSIWPVFVFVYTHLHTLMMIVHWQINRSSNHLGAELLGSMPVGDYPDCVH